ncbi:MAG: hypothetical protein ACNYPF_04335 [Candidatus Puniceispirillales bacterium WSBS_2018_MAG_OTU23]
MTTQQKWQANAELLISALIRDGRTATYKDLVEKAAIPPPKKIHQLTRFLEELVARDAALNLPIRAAVVVSRTNGIPGEGFFVKLAECGITPDDGSNNAALHQQLISQL